MGGREGEGGLKSFSQCISSTDLTGSGLMCPQSVIAREQSMHEVAEDYCQASSFHNLVWPDATVIENSYDREILINITISNILGYQESFSSKPFIYRYSIWY